MRKLITIIIMLVFISSASAMLIDTRRGVVVFPHLQHTFYLKCGICHNEDDSITSFASEKIKNREGYKPSLHHLCLICHLALRPKVGELRVVPPIICTKCHGVSA